ncbi:MAG: DUF4190 domain-containing protein [Pyrinomonadaceae bacterium]
MKQCPRCRQVYADDQLNFCLSDGELLSFYLGGPNAGQQPGDDSPPTLVIDPPRPTDPIGWSAGPPIASYSPLQSQMPQFGYGAGGFQYQQPSQTLPTVAMVLGIGSLLFSCCYGGFWLGLPAAVLGFIGMRNADSQPALYGGRGMAITGLVLGTVSFLISLLIAFGAAIGR